MFFNITRRIHGKSQNYQSGGGRAGLNRQWVRGKAGSAITFGKGTEGLRQRHGRGAGARILRLTPVTRARLESWAVNTLLRYGLASPGGP